MAFNPTRRLALTLEAVLRVTLVHELGRWFFTLVSRYQFQITYSNRFAKYSGGDRIPCHQISWMLSVARILSVLAP